ncbi:MAG: hypothetical protein HYU42_09430 [Candidatus Rokubacteria bacterium]|nr:hypothetical protein [Candidatus Rokubacteria bacterium]MBI3106923.1 hypothetical protein [Candidatus Rokubacteria bacterium]
MTGRILEGITVLSDARSTVIFTLGPGVSWMLPQSMMGVPLTERFITSRALSAERAPSFWPPGTSREALRARFCPVAEGGRLIEMGATGIAVTDH